MIGQVLFEGSDTVLKLKAVEVEAGKTFELEGWRADPTTSKPGAASIGRCRWFVCILDCGAGLIQWRNVKDGSGKAVWQFEGEVDTEV